MKKEIENLLLPYFRDMEPHLLTSITTDHLLFALNKNFNDRNFGVVGNNLVAYEMGTTKLMDTLPFELFKGLDQPEITLKAILEYLR